MTFKGILDGALLRKSICIALLFAVFVLLLKSTGTVSADLLSQKKILVGMTITMAFVSYLVSCSKNLLGWVTFFSLLYGSTAYIKLFTDAVLRGNEISSAIALGVMIGSFLIIVFAIRTVFKNKVISCILYGISYVLGMAAILFPLLFFCYYLATGALLSSDILLTLFQTNTNEIASYLKGQDLFRWGGTLLLICVCMIFFCYFNRLVYFGVSVKRLISCGILILIMCIFIVPKAGQNAYILNTIDSAREELVTFKKYGEAKLRRQKQLQSLTDLKIREDSGGIYVLVIGESETRDHMHIYGYERENTPFLDSLKSLPDAVIFSHAYSNHTHTVPCLTFALSERNQYNDINLVDAYSVVEVAKAAGYDTYWLSNQERFSPWDTPVAEIASVADRQVWLNGNVGKQINTFYYDGKLLDFIPDMSNMTNGFIIIHLMGNHLSYDDRYPEAFNKFSRGDKTIDTYDNSILYNDFVLRSIYEKVKNVPHFQGMIYLSDHGDDADKHLGHESSKFTYRMAHIPLIMLFSESFMQNRRELYETLKSHKDSYWTNDLLYNVMVNILGVQGIPNSEPVLDLGNEKYGGSADILMTLHGRKRISEDPSVKN